MSDAKKMNIKSHDPKTYIECCRPHENADAANAAITAFFEEVYAARVKHQIADVAMVCKVFATYSSGCVGDAMLPIRIGNDANHEAMFAFGLGSVQASNRERTNKLIASGKDGDATLF